MTRTWPRRFDLPAGVVEAGTQAWTDLKYERDGRGEAVTSPEMVEAVLRGAWPLIADHFDGSFGPEYLTECVSASCQRPAWPGRPCCWKCDEQGSDSHIAFCDARMAEYP